MLSPTQPVTEFIVKSLKALTDYKFRVIALNKSIMSESSNEIAVTTPYAMTTTITKSGYALQTVQTLRSCSPAKRHKVTSKQFPQQKHSNTNYTVFLLKTCFIFSFNSAI
ncbi:MAG: fibronectin type III domain-containing protein [Planctomycetaceae bacterium]|jgi:hypothetical protein|nr:fibronectin type III domain-containing protein [Planctomycetaceae bacterium]